MLKLKTHYGFHDLLLNFIDIHKLHSFDSIRLWLLVIELLHIGKLSRNIFLFCIDALYQKIDIWKVTLVPSNSIFILQLCDFEY